MGFIPTALEKSLRTRLWPSAWEAQGLLGARRSLKYHLSAFLLGQFSPFKMMLLNSSSPNFTLMRHCNKITFPTLV